ncbi:uncharacterized protein LOC143277542 [Babylonia areolata]|uniref:uncharacterized protein LOC143277542 n=1 Tax=Babylonia areolata TaxID=304850 RepID=UPI003FD48002
MGSHFIVFVGVVFHVTILMLCSTVNAFQTSPPRFTSSKRLTFKGTPLSTVDLLLPIQTHTRTVLGCRVDTVPPGGKLPFSTKYVTGSCQIKGSPPNCTVHASLSVRDQDPTGVYSLHVDNGHGIISVIFGVESNPDLDTTQRQTTTTDNDTTTRVTAYVTTLVTTTTTTTTTTGTVTDRKTMTGSATLNGSDDLIANDVVTTDHVNVNANTVGIIHGGEDFAESNPSPGERESGLGDPSSVGESEENVLTLQFGFLLGAVGFVVLLVIIVGTVLGVLIKRQGRQQAPQTANSGAVELAAAGEVLFPSVGIPPVDNWSGVEWNSRNDGCRDGHLSDNVYDLIQDGSTEVIPAPPAEQGWSETLKIHHWPRQLSADHERPLPPPPPPPADNRPPLCHTTCQNPPHDSASTTTTSSKARFTRESHHPGSSSMSTPKGLPTLCSVSVTQRASLAAPPLWCTGGQRSLADAGDVNRPRSCLPSAYLHPTLY